jgi:dipeptidyl aminopeptidase/acylaminoacyl peptidase
VILFDGTANDPIHRVSAAGGVAVVAVKPDAARKETQAAWPEFLPDGKHYLYMASSQKAEENAYRIGSLGSTESKLLMPAQTLVSYAPPGYLLFVRDKTLVAQRFDPKAQKTLGEPVPLAEQIGTDSVGLARFSVSREGTLAYRTGESGSRLLWVDRAGKEIETAADPGELGNPALSPRGDRLAFDLGDTRSGKPNIWIRDLARGVSSRFTFGATGEVGPLWSPDGSRVVFSVIREPAFDLFEKPAASEGEAKELLKTNELKVASDWSRDGRYIAFSSQGKETKFDIWMLPTFGDKRPIPFLKTEFAEMFPVFSPDGRYLAYQSNESGRAEIYVQSFPGPGRKWQVSTAGGSEPSWRSDGKEIFYRAPDQKLMGVEVTIGDTFQAGVPKPLFVARVQAGRARNKYLAAAGGQRFLLVAPLGREAMTPTTVVLNWFAELTR